MGCLIPGFLRIPLIQVSVGIPMIQGSDYPEMCPIDEPVIIDILGSLFENIKTCLIQRVATSS